MFKIYEFHWRAENRFQQKHRGKLLAATREEAENKLTAKGYQQIQLKRNFTLSTAPKFEEITQCLNQLSLLLNAAIPLKTALIMVLESCYQIKLALWLTQMIQHLDTGFRFSDSLAKQRKYLTHQEIQLIQMAEKSGHLGTVLASIVNNRQKSEKLNKKVKKILFYPAIVLFISLSLSLMLLIFIVPQFADLYQSKDKQLPFITSVLFSLSEFLTENTFSLLFFLILFLLGVFLFSKTVLFLKVKTKLLNHLPILGKVIHYSRLIFFSQNLALMLNAHLRLELALNAFLSEQHSDPILQKEITFILSLLKQGYRFSEGLNPTIFESQIVQMVAIGEKSGKLAEMLNNIADIYQQKLDFQIDILSQLLEPLLMLIMGAIVGVIMVGLYLPIFDMGAIVG